MKKKNLALTKRVVSFITAACLSLSSTIMVLPASAEEAPVGSTTQATVGGTCSENGCVGTYAWAEDGSGNHVLKCNAAEQQHTAEGTSHTAGSVSDEVCTLCAAMPDVTISSIDSPEGFSIKVICDEESVATGTKIASGSTLTLSIDAEEGKSLDGYDVVWSITGGAENSDLTANTTDGTTTVSGVVSDITIGATLTAKTSGDGDESGNAEEMKYTVSYTAPTGSDENYEGTFTVTKPGVNENAENVATGSTVAPGTVITIVPAPESGYEVDTVKVNETTVAADDDGAYKYTVIANVTSITVTFKAIEYIVSYTATTDEDDGGTFTVTKPGESDSVNVGNGDKVAYGTEITITATPAENYRVNFVKVNSDPISVSNGVYKYTVNADVAIVVSFEPSTPDYPSEDSYDVDKETGLTGGSIEIVSDGPFAAGDTVSFKVKADENYQLKAGSVKVYSTNDSETTVSVTSEPDENGCYSFTMPGYDVTITAEFEEIATYTVTTKTKGVVEADQDSVTVDVKCGENGTDAIPSAGVAAGTKIVVTPNGGEKYTVKSVTYSRGEVLADVATTPDTNGGYTFTMPEGNVIVTVTFEKVPEKYTVSSNVTNGTIAATEDSSFAEVAAGTNVKFTVNPVDGFTLKTDSVKVMNGETAVEVTAPTDNVNYYSFTMPEGNVSITATFIAKVSAVKNNDGSYTITSTENGGAGEGYNPISVKTADLLGIGVALDDVQSFSFDYAFDTAANANANGNGSIGVNCGSWKQELWNGSNASSGTVTIDVDGTADGEDLLIQIYYMAPNSTLTISNIKANTTEYSITVAESANGTVEVPAKAQFGEEVTLKVTPAKNYVLDKLTVTYKATESSGAVLVEVKDGKFAMPEGNVTVTAEFKAIESVFTVKIGDVTSTDKLDTWAEVLNYVKDNGSEDKIVTIEVNGEAEFTGVLPTAKQAKALAIKGDGTLTFAGNVTALKINYDTEFQVKLALSSENAKKVNVTVAAGKFFILNGRQEYINIFGKVSGTKTSVFGVVSKVTVDQISTFGEVIAGEGRVIVNGNVSGVTRFDGSITLVNSLTGTKATTVAIDNVSHLTKINLVANEKGVLPKLTVTTVEAPDEECSATIKVVNADGDAVDLTSGTIVAYTKGNNVEDNITIGNKSGDKDLKAFYYSKTKALKAEIADAMTVVKSSEEKGKDYPNLELALASMTEKADYILKLNADATVANLVMPRNITGLTIDATGTAKLIITGTKLNVTKNLTLDLPVEVEKGKTNKTGKLDVTVAKGQMLSLTPDFTGDVLNKITGTNTSVLYASSINASQISTFKTIDGTFAVTGNVSNVTNFCGSLTVSGAKSKINITNVVGESSISLVQDEKGAIPALTVSDIDDLLVDGATKTGLLSITVAENGSNSPVALTSGTTVATIKAVTKGTPAEDVAKKIKIVNTDSNSNELTANYYSKTRTVKAEYNEAIYVYYGEIGDDTKPAAMVANLDKALEDIAKQTTAVDVTLEINSDITAAASFALPKKNVSSITFIGEGSITFLGTKLAIPYDTELDVEVIASNKAKALDLTVSSTKAKPVELTVSASAFNDYNCLGKVTGNAGATLTVDGGYPIRCKGISKFDTVTGRIDVTGNVANVGVFSGHLDVYGAKTSVSVGEIRNFGTKKTEIYLNEESNTLPKVTIASIEKDSFLELGVYSDEFLINLESGRTVLYTKDNKFADAGKITISNNWDDEHNLPTMAASYDAKTRTIKAVNELAVSLFVYDENANAGEGEFVAVTEDGSNVPVRRKSLEEIVAIIDGRNDTEAVYSININSSVEVAKLALPTKAERVIIVGNNDVVVNIGKNASITAATDIELENVIFNTTAKTLTLTAKKSVLLNGYTTIDAFKGSKGNKRLDEEHSMRVVGSSSTGDCYDVSGFDTLYVGSVKPEDSTADTNPYKGDVTINTTLDVTNLVLEDDSVLRVDGNLKKGQFANFESGKNARIYYGAMGKTTLKFTGRNELDFNVDSTTGLKIDAAYGTKILTTRVLNDLDIFKDYYFNYENPNSSAIKPKFTQVGNDIVYLRESFALSSTKGGSLGNFSRWDDVVAKIAELKDNQADYTIALREDLGDSSAAAVKFPKAGTYKSLTISSASNVNSSFCFTGSLTLTGNTTFKNVFLKSVKLVKNEPQDVKFNINANAYDVVFDDSYARYATVNANNLTVKNCNFDVEKITVRNKLTTKLDDYNYIRAAKGVQTKNWVLESDTYLYLGFKSTVNVTGELSAAETVTAKLIVCANDMTGNSAKTFAKNYSIGSVKKGYELVELFNEGYKVVADAKNGTLKVEKAIWKWNGNVLTFTALEGSTTAEVNPYLNVYNGSVKLADLLAKGKTLADVESITCDIVFANGWGGGTMGLNKNDSSVTYGKWVQGDWANPADSNKTTCTISVGETGINSTQSEISIQIWWVGSDEGNAVINFSNFQFHYKGDNSITE